MPPNTSDRQPIPKSDREFYAHLWGTHGRAARARETWHNLRTRSGFIALVAAAGLLCYVTLFPALTAGPRRELVTGPGIDAASSRPLLRAEPAEPDEHPPASRPAATTSATRSAAAPSDAATTTTTTVAPTTTVMAAAAKQPTPPLPVIFDTDIGNDIDDSLALAMLHAYDAAGVIDLLAVTINYNNAHAASYADTINTYYGAPDTPIATIKSGGFGEGNDSFHRQVALDTQRFPHDLASDQPTPDAVAMLRTQLAAQADNSVVIVAVGFATNLAGLLLSGPDDVSPLSGRDLVAQKVKLLSNMAGEFTFAQPEYNVAKDPASARLVYQQWPTPIVTSEWQVGADVPFPGEVLAAMDDEAANPLLEAYKLHGRNTLQVAFPYHQPSFDLTSVLYAVEPDARYFEVGEAGEISVDERSITSFVPGGHGRHRLLQQPADTDQTRRIVHRFVELVTALPDR